MKSGDNGLYGKIALPKIKKIQEEITMYRIFTTIENDETDLIIKYLERVQLGYSDLILLGMENGWSGEMILDDIEALVKRCFDDENANMINQRHFSDSSETEAYIKKISHDIFWRLKILNNY